MGHELVDPSHSQTLRPSQQPVCAANAVADGYWSQIALTFMAEVTVSERKSHVGSRGLEPMLVLLVTRGTRPSVAASIRPVDNTHAAKMSTDRYTVASEVEMHDLDHWAS
jgi:hypothetical protein